MRGVGVGDNGVLERLKGIEEGSLLHHPETLLKLIEPKGTLMIFQNFFFMEIRKKISVSFSYVFVLNTSISKSSVRQVLLLGTGHIGTNKALIDS